MISSLKGHLIFVRSRNRHDLYQMDVKLLMQCSYRKHMHEDAQKVTENSGNDKICHRYNCKVRKRGLDLRKSRKGD